MLCGGSVEFDVAWSLMLSVEFDVEAWSLMLKLVCEEYDGDVRSLMLKWCICTKITKGRRKTLPKDHSPLNHMNSHYTRGWG